MNHRKLCLLFALAVSSSVTSSGVPELRRRHAMNSIKYPKEMPYMVKFCAQMAGIPEESIKSYFCNKDDAGKLTRIVIYYYDLNKNLKSWIFTID